MGEDGSADADGGFRIELFPGVLWMDCAEGFELFGGGVASFDEGGDIGIALELPKVGAFVELPRSVPEGDVECTFGNASRWEIAAVGLPSMKGGDKKADESGGAGDALATENEECGERCDETDEPGSHVKDHRGELRLITDRQRDDGAGNGGGEAKKRNVSKEFDDFFHGFGNVAWSVGGEPVGAGAVFDFDGDVVRQREGGAHGVEDFRDELFLFVGGEVEDEFVVDLEEHFALVR